jgi:predicted dehydrogenase
VCDPDAPRRGALARELGIPAFAGLDEALAGVRAAAVFVCTPPALHVPACRKAVAAGAHLFVEKPLSSRREGVSELAAEATAAGRLVQVGYNLRFHPVVRRVRDLVSQGAVGRPLWGAAEVAAYLPDWRPAQDYRRNYTARRELGGGIILDGSHEIDYLVWMLGRPDRVLCMGGRVSRLEVDVEDCATMLLHFPSGMHVDVHMDFVQQGYVRTGKLAGEEGTLAWSLADQYVKRYLPREKRWETETFLFDLNQMYLDEAAHFLECVEKGRAPLVGLEDGRAALGVALAALRSMESGRAEVPEY